MRYEKLKFKEISELSSFIDLLKDERSFNQSTQSNAVAKLNSGEFAEEDLGLFAITRDELKQQVRSSEDDTELVDNIIRSKSLELRLMYKEKDRLLKKYSGTAIKIEYYQRKNRLDSIYVGQEILQKIVHSIKYELNREKDRLEFVVIFDDLSLITKYTGLKNLFSVIVKDV